MRTYRDYLPPKLDPTNGRPVFPLSFIDRPARFVDAPKAAKKGRG